VIIAVAILLPVFLTAAFLLGLRWPRKREFARLSAVTRQHIELLQGGRLNEAALESARERITELLDRGDLRAVEAGLRPGTQYVVQVRALTDIGTEDAGRILERQLHRRLTRDAIEQCWYWIDLASGLRNLNRNESLPQLLRCAETDPEFPLGHFFAAETVCFLSFGGFVRRPQTPLGRAALRVLHRALEGLRTGVQPQVVTEGRLGEVISELWDNRREQADALIVRVFGEALRVLRRAPHAELLLAEEQQEQEDFSWQISHLASLEASMVSYLEEAPAQLCRELPAASSMEQANILIALEELRADCAQAVLPLLKNPEFEHRELAVRALTWSRDAAVGPWLRGWIGEQVSVPRRCRGRKAAVSPKRPSVPAEAPYGAVLRALRGHPSPESEAFLAMAALDFDPTYRAIAVSSLGWWEPLAGDNVNRCLREARRDPNHDVRLMARAGLARLGERSALSWFRQALKAADSTRVHETIQTAANEGLFFLWPDLDQLADSERIDVAVHACEALERLREQLSVKPL
jgi:hypothetical protein